MALVFVLLALALSWTVMLLFGGLDLDRAILTLLYAGDRPQVAAAARIVTQLGSAEVLIPLTLAGAAWLVFRRRFKSAATLVVASFGGRLLVEFQKDWMMRLRPADHRHLVEAQSYAFPSGHSANSAIVYLMLALLLTTSYPRRMIAVWAAAWLAVLVGASRVALGVHWPTDVIGGWSFALFWTLLLLRLTGHEVGDGTPRAVRHSSREGDRT